MRGEFVGRYLGIELREHQQDALVEVELGDRVGLDGLRREEREGARGLRRLAPLYREQLELLDDECEGRVVGEPQRLRRRVGDRRRRVEEPAQERAEERLDVVVVDGVVRRRVGEPRGDRLARVQHEVAELPPPQRDALGRRRVLLLRARAAARLPPQLGPRERGGREEGAEVVAERRLGRRRPRPPLRLARARRVRLDAPAVGQRGDQRTLGRRRRQQRARSFGESKAREERGGLRHHLGGGVLEPREGRRLHVTPPERVPRRRGLARRRRRPSRLRRRRRRAHRSRS